MCLNSITPKFITQAVNSSASNLENETLALQPLHFDPHANPLTLNVQPPGSAAG